MTRTGSHSPLPSRSGTSTRPSASPAFDSLSDHAPANALSPRPKDMIMRLADELGDVAQTGNVVRVLELFQDIKTLEMPQLIDECHSDKHLSPICLAAMKPDKSRCRIVVQLFLLKGSSSRLLDQLGAFLGPDELEVATWARETARRYELGDRRGFRAAEELLHMSPCFAEEYLQGIASDDETGVPAHDYKPQVDKSGRLDTRSKPKKGGGKNRKRERARVSGRQERGQTKGGAKMYWDVDVDVDEALVQGRGPAAKRQRQAAFGADPLESPNEHAASHVTSVWPADADFVALEADSSWTALEESPAPTFSPLVPPTQQKMQRSPSPQTRRHTAGTVRRAVTQQFKPEEQLVGGSSGQPDAQVAVDTFTDEAAGGLPRSQSRASDGEPSAQTADSTTPPIYPRADSSTLAVLFVPDAAPPAAYSETAPDDPDLDGVAYEPTPASASLDRTPTPARRLSPSHSVYDPADTERVRQLNLNEKDIRAIIRVERLKRKVAAADYDAVLRTLRRYIDCVEEGT